MSVSDNLENLLKDLVNKDFIEEKDSKALLKDLKYFTTFKKKYEFEFEDKNISDYFDENNKNKIKNIFVVIGQENLGKTYFIKLLNCALSKEKKLISKEEVDYQRNKINFKIIDNKYLIARINLNPIFSKSEEAQLIFEYFKYSNLLLNYASKIFYVTNNENFDLTIEEYKNEINEQLIYFNFDINKDNENKFIIVKNLFYNNVDNKNNKDDIEIISPQEIILSSELFDNLKIINFFLKKKKDNEINNHNIILFKEIYKDIGNYYLNRYDFSRQLNNCNVDYNYGIDLKNRLMFYIEVPEENEYKITAKSIVLNKYVLISIVGEIVNNKNNNNENENTKKKFEIYENIEKKHVEKVLSIEKVGTPKQIKDERAYLVKF